MSTKRKIDSLDRDENNNSKNQSTLQNASSSSGVDWLTLPNNALIRIFEFLYTPRALMNCSLVCKRWRNAIARDGETIWRSFLLRQFNIEDSDLCGFTTWMNAWNQWDNSHYQNFLVTREAIDDNIKNSKDCMFLTYLRPPLLPSFLWTKTHLHSLSLHGNDLVALPTSISCLKNLDFLDLSHNKLTSITPITALSKLTSLWINNNRLESLPAQITNLQNLYNLIFSFNQIRVLPTYLSSLTNLELLHFANNSVEHITPSLSTLTNLRVLDASRNRLHAGSFPTQLTTLTSLKNLFLSDNLLESLPTVPICCWTSLTVLYLDGNSLSWLPPEFWKLTSLKTLWIQRNAVLFSEAAFSKLTNLNQLEVQAQFPSNSESTAE